MSFTDVIDGVDECASEVTTGDEALCVTAERNCLAPRRLHLSHTSCLEEDEGAERGRVEGEGVDRKTVALLLQKPLVHLQG